MDLVQENWCKLADCQRTFVKLGQINFESSNDRLPLNSVHLGQSYLKNKWYIFGWAILCIQSDIYWIALEDTNLLLRNFPTQKKVHWLLFLEFFNINISLIVYYFLYFIFKPFVIVYFIYFFPIHLIMFYFLIIY